MGVHNKMYYLLIQNDAHIEDTRELIAKRYIPSSILYSTGNNLPKTPPILSDKWLIFIRLFYNPVKQIKNVLSSNCPADFVFTTSQRDGSVETALSFFIKDFKVIDNSRPPLEKLIGYIQKELGVSENLATIILNRSRKYEPNVIHNVMILKLLSVKKLSKKIIDKYLPDKDFVSLFVLYDYILYKHTQDYPKVLKIVNDYQNAIKFLCSYIIRRLDDDIFVYNLILHEGLDSSNYILMSEKLKMPLYKIEHSLKIFFDITLETLIFKRHLYTQLMNSSAIEFIWKGCR